MSFKILDDILQAGKKIIGSNAAAGATHDAYKDISGFMRGLPIFGATETATSVQRMAKGKALAKTADIADEGLAGIETASRAHIDDLMKRTGATQEDIGKHISEGTFEETYKGIDGFDPKAELDIRQSNAKKADKFAAAAYGDRKESYKNKVGAVTSYMTGDGNILTGAARIGGAAVVARHLGGGTMTRNNQGEKDIAGIPFI